MTAEAETKPRVCTWLPVDLADVLDGGWAPPQPTIGRRADGVGLFYPGKVHTVASESEAGKTWFVVHAVADEIRDGNHVVYIDFEDDAGPIVHRLLALQVVPDLIRARFHYIRPEVAIMQGESREDLEGTLNAYGPTLVVIEGVTEAMSVHGYNPLDNAEVAAFGRRLPRWIAETGPAVVCVDHVTKASDGRGRYAIGAVHKLNAVDGAAYLLENVAPFVIGRTGRTRVRIAKDRPGYLRAKSLPGTGGLSWFGDFVLISHAAEFAEAEVEAPRERDDDFRPTELMRRICDLLAEKGPQSQRTIRAAIGGRSETVTSALAYLALDGYVSDSTPRELLRPYPGGES